MRISDWSSDVCSSDLVEADDMGAVADHRDAAGVDGLDGAHRVAFDAGDLDEAANGIAGEAEVVLHADFGGVLDLGVGAAERGGQPRGRHRAGAADLAPAAAFGARDAGGAAGEAPAGGGRG